MQMKKYLVLSFDDGTIYDKRFIKLLDKYGIPATFNLNSGLDDYIWYYNDTKPICRLKLKENIHLYKNHEIASHTLTHPYLTSLSKEDLLKEVKIDIKNLEKIFKRKVVSFGTPFDKCSEREINIIKENTSIKYFRIPLIKAKNDFSIPSDPFHIGINALYDDENIYEQIENFANNTLDKSLFVIVGHSYDFEVNNHWEYIENLLKYISSFKEFEIKTFGEAIKALFDD